MKRALFILCVALLLPAMLAAQAKPAAQGQRLILEFVDGPDFSVTTADKAVLKINAGIFEGDAIPVGAVIATGPGTSAELRIRPNGSILKLAKSTTFTVTAIGATSKDSNAFALAAGKVRAVAAKGGAYEIRSNTAVCGVRGTDFSFGVEEGAKALLMVAEGLVQFDKLDSAGSILGSLPIAAGQAADAFAGAFEAFAFDAAQFAEQFADLAAFTRLKIEEVPPQALDEEPPAQPASGEAVAPPEEPTGEAQPEAAAAEKEPEKPESPIMKWLREALGMEIGSVTINETTYSKAIIQPNLVFGKVKLGLYLPIIYSSDLFDPSDWYWPAGNNEWDFGYQDFKGGEYLNGAADLARDLALKIKYFEYGRQLVDPFFIKVGNLNDLTLGHGLIMRNYANDTEFPSVRRVGFNVGFDGGGGGFEALTNDLAAPEIIGLRGFVRPVKDFKLAIGLSAAVDIDPAADLPDDVRATTGDPMFIGAGVDLDLPIVTSGLLSLRLFADGAVTVPWATEAAPGIDKGLRYELVWADNKVKNWGAAGGVLGNVLFIDYRLEYRYFTGLFRPAFFDSTYGRMRGQYAVEYAGYLNGSRTYSETPTVMGVYGEGGFKILKDKLGLTLGYMMPWSPDQSFDEVSGNDEFHAKLYIKKGLVPIVDVAGSISYDRRGLAAAIADTSKKFKLFDENTFFGGEVVVPVPKTPNLDLAVIFATAPATADDGSVIYADAADEAAGIPEMRPSISIETRFHF